MAFYAVFAAFAVILVAQAGGSVIGDCSDVDANVNRSLAKFDAFKSRLDVTFAETIKHHAEDLEKKWVRAMQRIMANIENHSKTLNENCTQIGSELPGVLDELLKGTKYCVHSAIEDYRASFKATSVDQYESSVRALLMRDCIYGTSSSKNNNRDIQHSLAAIFGQKEMDAMSCIIGVRYRVYIKPIMTRIANAGEQCEYTVFPGRRPADWKEPKE